jgi:hypothetical protein
VPRVKVAEAPILIVSVKLGLTLALALALIFDLINVVL